MVSVEFLASIIATLAVNGTTIILARMAKKTNADYVRNVQAEMEQWKEKYEELKKDWKDALKAIEELKDKLRACEEARELWLKERVKFLERFAREEPQHYHKKD